MSGLFGSLGIAARALEAQRTGLDVVGQNMANVNTAGYSRREVDFAEVPPYERFGAGNGVEVEDIRAVRDMLLERRYRQELPTQSRAAAIADQLAVVETALGKPGESIDKKLTAFFDSFSSLAQDPTSATARQQVVVQAQSLATAFHDMSSRLDSAQRSADASIVGAVDQTNSLVTEISQLNVAIAQANGAGADAQSLKDQQNEAVNKLAKVIDVSVMQRQDGGVDVTFGAGHPLVIGEVTYSLVSNPVGPLGLSQLMSNGIDVTSEIKGGSIGGLLQVRDSMVPQYRNDLDQIAYTVTNQVNTLHDAGFDLSGNGAGVFFTALGSVSGAAAAIAVDPAVAADPSLVAAASIASPGDNQTARAISALRDARVMSGHTATMNDSWGRIIYRAGTDSATAKSDVGSHDEIVRQMEGLRDATSGVSLDEEAMSMLKFQRAYEASAKFFTTINGALDTLMNMVS